jgi:predicted nucleic acid-binding protein
LAFDLEAVLRTLKPEKSVGQLNRRQDKALRFVSEDATDSPLLLDTTVYIDQLTDRLPDAVRGLLGRSVINHSSIAVIELCHPFGRLDPALSSTAANLDQIRATIAAITPNRLLLPSLKACVQASIIAGVMARRKALAKTDQQPFIHDATLYFQALETGSVLLTRNIKDIDLIQQLAPIGKGRVLFYREL